MQSLFSKIKSWFSKGSSPFRRSSPFRNWLELRLPLTYGFKFLNCDFQRLWVDLVISNNWCSFAKLSVNLLSNQANSLLFYEFRKFYYEMIDLPSIYSAFKGLANAFSLHKFLKSHQSFKDMRSHTCKWASTMGTRPPICTKEGCVYTPKWHYDYKKTRKLLIRDFLTAVNLAYIKNIWKNIWE